MKLLGTLVAATSVLTITATQANACSCGGVHGRTAWETAAKETQWGAAIFEGTLESFSIQWNVLSARPGELIQMDPSGSEVPENNWPRMLITMRVKRVYKGDLGTVVQLHTGMGGGDCGAQYATGLDYLVYASASNPAGLWTSICHPGGWLGSNYLATALRYLRKERPLAGDLSPSEYRIPSAVARRERDREEYNRRYAAATGQICGFVNPAKIDGQWQRVAFLSTAGYSLNNNSTVEVNRDGTFCSSRLGPGGYYLYFTRGSWNGDLESAVYYPGVTGRAKAKIVEVGAGQVQSNLAFRIPKQETYTVHGFVFADDKPGIGDRRDFVHLFGLDGWNWRSQTVTIRGPFPPLRSGYFAFENVLPGRYIAWGSISGRDWFTRIVEVNVTTHAKLILLDLKHINASAVSSASSQSSR